MNTQMILVEIREAIPWVIWSILKNRNAILYSQVQELPEVIIQRAMEEARQWKCVNMGAGNQSVTIRKLYGCKDKWQPPFQGIIKCNINSHWRNANLHCGAAWITRDFSGSVLFHARDALTCSINRITAELRCVVWALRSLLDLQLSDIIMALDSQAAFDALSKPNEWPTYRDLLHQIEHIRLGFKSCIFEHEGPSSNSVARSIAQSVTKDGRFHSYLALGVP